MIILAIETATDMVGVALVAGDGAAAERVHLGGRAHAELLAPSIEEVCAVSGVRIGDVGAIAVDVGPGLFTGLRVGVATAKALAQSLGVGVVPVLSLDVLAAAVAGGVGPDGPLDGARPDGPPTAVAAVVDARRGEVFAAVYRFDRAAPSGPWPAVDPKAVRDDRPVPLAPEELVEWLLAVAAEAGRVTVVGDGAVRYRHLLAVHGALDVDRAGSIASPPPLALAGLARSRLAAGEPPLPGAGVVPEYRRPADARINWEQRPPADLPPARPTDPAR